MPLGRKDACLAIPAYGPGLKTEMAWDADGSAPSQTELGRRRPWQHLRHIFNLMKWF